MGDREDLERLEVELKIEKYNEYDKQYALEREAREAQNGGNSGCASVILVFTVTAGLLGYLALWLTHSLF